MRYRIGIDIGGTFTDFALFDDESGGVRIHKQLTTPDDPAEAVIEGIAALCRATSIEPREVGVVAHGTTLVTNAVIERRGVPTAMLVTRGFADVLDIALERRYDLFDLRIRFPDPVVPRALRIEVDERIGYDGRVMAPLQAEDTEAALAEAVRSHSIEAVAICFLHSYANPRHERAMAEWVRRRFTGLAVSSSADVFPFMREYQRWTTACLNAYVQPVVDRYIARLEQGLAGLGFAGRFVVMSSSGGTLTPETARRFPIRMLESGPAAGALMSARHGRMLDLPQLLSFDMGGTTAKGCIIQEGVPLKRYEMEVARVHEFKKGSGLPVKIPVLDMIEIGAGGGSLAEVDERGTLRVGPKSAGARPGPACYGRGGSRPTLTDANLILGYLDARSFLGGQMALDPAAAREAIDRHVAQPLGVSIERAAFGIHEVINEDVARAFRVHASERGVDYRRCSIVAFGGSGPLHAARVARKLRIPRLICPWGAGVMSAFGLLTSPLGFELVQSRRVAVDELTPTAFCDQLGRLAAQAAGYLTAAGVPAEGVRMLYRLDMRYVGQGYEIEVPLPDVLSGDVLARLPALFDAEYEKVFGQSFARAATEIVAWKVDAQGPITGDDTLYALAGETDAGAAVKARRPIYAPERDAFGECPVYDRYALKPGARIAGPAVIEERESTCVLNADDVGEIDRFGNVVVQLGSAV
jgi:N-methylhydantoinase A